MTMTPNDFQTLLRDAVAHEPPSGSVAGDVALGRRLLRRRRWLSAAGAAAVVLATAGTVNAVAHDGSSRTSSHVPAATQAPTAAASPTPDGAHLLRSCRNGNASDRAVGLIFGSGTPTVKAVNRTSHQVLLAIESGDGSHWAECFIHLDNQEFASGMTVYDSSGRSTETSYSFGPGCGLVDNGVDASCKTFAVGWVDRRPAEVAGVEFAMGDGTTTTVESPDGYVVLNYLAELPAGTEMGEYGLPGDFQPFHRITFLDADGNPIAAEAQDGSGSGPDGERVGDLPLLSAFPALRSAQPIY